MASSAVPAVISAGFRGITTKDACASGGTRVDESYLTASHVCCLYDTDAEHNAVVARFVRDGLVRNEKVISILDVDERTPFLNSLAFDDEMVISAVTQGQLILTATDETYLAGSAFHSTQMITQLARETQTALAEGYTGLRVTSDMEWVHRRSIPIAELIRYEAVVNDFFAQHRCMGLCRYHKFSFPTAVLMDIVALHPLLILKGRLYTNAQHTLFSDLLNAIDDRTDK